MASTIASYKLSGNYFGVAESKYDERSFRSLKPQVGVMSCRFFIQGEPLNKTAAVLSVFYSGGTPE